MPIDARSSPLEMIASHTQSLINTIIYGDARTAALRRTASEGCLFPLLSEHHDFATCSGLSAHF